jgi:hypothetical protein
MAAPTADFAQLNLPPLSPYPAPPLLPGEHSDILLDVADTIPSPESWLDSPNTHLGMRTPRSVIGTDREGWVRQILRWVKFGAVT